MIMLRLLALAVLVFATGCAGGARLRYSSPQEAYERGQELYERGKYERASQYFQGVFDFGRAHEWADDAQLQLARSFRGNREYILAASEYSRFAEIYRTDPRAGDAEFERAMTFFERSPGFELDQSSTERGIEVFNVFIQRFTDHDSVMVAVRRVDELREKLAYKQFFNAQLYERRGLFEAAGLSYEVVFDKYPDTPLADDALVGAIRCYIDFSDQSVEQRQPERLQKSIDHYQRLLQIFPDSDQLQAAELLYERARAQMDILIPTPPQASSEGL